MPQLMHDYALEPELQLAGFLYNIPQAVDGPGKARFFFGIER
jgi:hypothetical protein